MRIGISSDIRALFETADITDRQRDLALQIFTAVAEAEAHVHGSTVEKVHFHEVGAVDSIVDILGAAIGFDLLCAEEIVCSPLPPGRGSVHIDHGICPVPAPGTAQLLKGIPLAEVPVEAELTTPTGAAIVKVLADRFAPLPAMTIEQVGYGAGTMDFPGRANLLRLFVGEMQTPDQTDVVTLLETNLDDVSAEVIGYAEGRLREAGAAGGVHDRRADEKEPAGDHPQRAGTPVRCRGDGGDSVRGNRHARHPPATDRAGHLRAGAARSPDPLGSRCRKDRSARRRSQRLQPGVRLLQGGGADASSAAAGGVPGCCLRICGDGRGLTACETRSDD